MFPFLFFGITYALACVVQPGPFQAFILSQSLASGWRKTIPLAVAPLISDLPIIILVLFILTKIPHEVLQILQSIGGLFLFYLAFIAYKTWRANDREDQQSLSREPSFFKAVLVNLLNPGPYIGWSLVMGPMLIKAWRINPVNGIALIIGFYSSMIIFTGLLIVLFSAAGNLGSKFKRISIGFSVIGLFLFGCYQLWSGVAGLL